MLPGRTVDEELLHMQKEMGPAIEQAIRHLRFYHRKGWMTAEQEEALKGVLN